jgi:septum formation protein
MVARLAAAKALAAACPKGGVVLAADTVVVLGRQILGKPASAAEARRMLGALSGRTHRVVTGVAVRSARGVTRAIDETRVTFRRIPVAEANAYIATGEPFDKAGAYHIEGGGAAFIDRIEGSPSNVAGLSVTTARRLLTGAGLFSLSPGRRGVT